MVAERLIKYCCLVACVTSQLLYVILAANASFQNYYLVLQGIFFHYLIGPAVLKITQRGLFYAGHDNLAVL